MHGIDAHPQSAHFFNSAQLGSGKMCEELHTGQNRVARTEPNCAAVSAIMGTSALSRFAAVGRTVCVAGAVTASCVDTTPAASAVVKVCCDCACGCCAAMSGEDMLVKPSGAAAFAPLASLAAAGWDSAESEERGGDCARAWCRKVDEGEERRHSEKKHLDRRMNGQTVSDSW